MTVLDLASFDTQNTSKLKSAEEMRLEQAAFRLRMSVGDAKLFFRNGFTEETVPADFIARWSMANYLRRHQERPPMWIIVSGMAPEYKPDYKQRRERVRALCKSAVLLIRRELKWNEEEQADKNVCPTIKAERSVFWDPAVAVCQWMEISQSKLSGFCRELTGSNLAQTIDNIRAESLKGKMRAEVRAFVVGLRKGMDLGGKGEWGNGGMGEEKEKADGDLGEAMTHGATFVTEDGDGERFDKWFVWKALKASRKAPEFCLNSWAQGFGFANYRRMYRACQVVYRKTPYQMVMELIEEALAAGETAGRMPAHPVSEFKEWTLVELEAELKAVRAYQFSP